MCGSLPAASLGLALALQWEPLLAVQLPASSSCKQADSQSTNLLPTPPSACRRESPQWRRGPPQKPVLCNACGTRYR